MATRVVINDPQLYSWSVFCKSDCHRRCRGQIKDAIIPLLISPSPLPTQITRKQTCAKVQKRSELQGLLSPMSGTLMDLGPRTSFLSWDSGNPGPQNYDLPQDPGNPGPQDFDMQRDPGNPGPQNFDSRRTLETQDLKIWICGKLWKPRTQNLKIVMSRDFKILEPYTIQYRISYCALCQGIQQVMSSDDRTPKT